MMPRYIMGGAGRNQSEKDSLTQELAIRRTPRDAWQEMPNWDAALAVAREWRADTAEARMRRPGRGVQFYAWDQNRRDGNGGFIPATRSARP